MKYMYFLKRPDGMFWDGSYSRYGNDWRSDMPRLFRTPAALASSYSADPLGYRKWLLAQRELGRNIGWFNGRKEFNKECRRNGISVLSFLRGLRESKGIAFLKIELGAAISSASPA